MKKKKEDLEGKTVVANEECFEDVMERFMSLARAWIFNRYDELGIIMSEGHFVIESDYDIALDRDYNNPEYQKIIIQFKLSPVKLYPLKLENKN